jgi:hypothetical protein
LKALALSFFGIAGGALTAADYFLVIFCLEVLALLVVLPFGVWHNIGYFGLCFSSLGAKPFLGLRA